MNFNGILTEYDKQLFYKSQLVTDSVIKVVTIVRRGCEEEPIDNGTRQSIIESCKLAALNAKAFKTIIGGSYSLF